jgi:hypothetical protein
VPPVLPPERWALTPPFHPCQTSRAFRRRLTGFPVRCHRASLGRRSILCGTFRSAVVAAGYPAVFNFAPWRYQARCPVKSSANHSAATFRRLRIDQRASGRCPDFPPAQPSCDDQASDHPARPPFSLYREKVRADREGFRNALFNLLQAEELLEFALAQDGHAKFLRFVVLRPRIGTHNDIIRLLAHRPGNFPAVLLHNLARFLSRTIR